jgi:quercetin dioxygenase-like cupin family protein
MRKMALRSALAVATLSIALSSTSFAGDCPAGKMMADGMKPGATEPKNVTDTVIGSIDLANGYGVAGKTLRMRKLVVQPGGIVPWHSHKERPANIYVVSGAITEYRSTCTVPIEHHAGDIAVEQGDLAHWWKNNTGKEAVLISSDIVPTPMMNVGGM